MNAIFSQSNEPILTAQVLHGQGHETIKFGGQEVKGQGHTGHEIDLEAS